jgi:hypothetical protein
MRCTRGSIALAMLSHFFGLWYHDFGVDFPWLDRMKPNHRSTLPPFNILPCAPRPISTCGMLLSARKSCIMDRTFFDERTDGASASRSQSRHSPLTLPNIPLHLLLSLQKDSMGCGRYATRSVFQPIHLYAGMWLFLVP